MSLPAVNFNDPGIQHALISYLKNHMTITIETGGFIDPNSRTIVLKVDDEVIDKADFSIRQVREYEG